MDTNLIAMSLGMGFSTIGIVAAILIGSKILKAVASKSWPTVRGQVTSTDLRTVRYSGHDYDGTADSAQAVVTDFAYDYKVSGESYTGKRVSFSDFVNKTGGALQALQQEFREQAEVDVHYNPRNPADSVLKPGAGIYNFTPLITAGLFLAAGIFLLSWRP